MTTRPVEKWTPTETLGDRVRRLRRAVKLNQIDFAAAIDVTPQALATYETGTRQPRSVVAFAKRIELAFNVPATWVLGLDTGDMHGPNGPGGGSVEQPPTSGDSPTHPYGELHSVAA